MTKDARRPPTRADTDAEVDRRLAKAAAWVHGDDLDEVAVQIHKETWHEHRLLGHLPAERRTPAIVERRDQLRRDLRDQMAELGLTPAARRGLGLSAAAVSAQNQGPGLTYRRTTNPRALLKLLVETGVMDAVVAGIKAEIAAERQNAHQTDDNERQNP